MPTRTGVARRARDPDTHDVSTPLTHKENPALQRRGSGHERDEMNENDDNTCITCGKPLDQKLDAEGWYPTAPWVPKRLGGAGRPACAEKRGKLTEVLDEMGVEYSIEPV